MTVTPLALAHIAQPIILQRAVQHCKSLSAPELLSFLGNLDSEAARFNRSDEAWRLFRDVASIARTELSRKAPGTYVTLAILK